MAIKKFSKKYYSKFSTLNFENIEFKIPNTTEEFLKTRYEIKNKISELVTDFDELDYFLNKAYWHNLKTTENLNKDSSSSIKDFINYLINKNIDFF